MQEQSLFIEAMEIADAAERSAFLDRACRGDPVLRERVEKLLQRHQQEDSFLASPAIAPAATGAYTPDPDGKPAQAGPSEGPGSVIGPFKLLQQIGEGGMGTVFMAEQTRPVQRMVALKIIKPGMDSKQVIARFEAERQALALMDHPSIAKVLDGGTTETGRPYFVMELVKGMPITKYCDERRLPPQERLRLFLQVCQAVQHAHQKGIIHRDLKPSNVLIALYDDHPVPKVIDFGIAKATGQKLTDRTMFTEFGQVVGTLEYMSPEQAGLNQLDIDTRSDIYSLGVLLYELLTGSTPLEKRRLKEAAMLELLRVIREEEPPRPSTRLSTTDELASVAANRGLEPKKLSGLVRGDLDWVVMKALEKDRNRRYETANDFAQDLQRYLNDEPVQACPPSMGYKLRKFVRRNKGPVLATAAFVFLLLAGITGTTTGLFRALAAEEQVRTERDQKDEALRETILERDAKEEARRKTRRALNMTTHEVVEELLGQQVQVTDRHREFLKKVLAEHQAFAAAGADDTESRQSQAEGFFHVGLIRHKLGESKEAEAAYRQAMALQENLADDFPRRAKFRFDLALTCSNLGVLLSETGRPKEAKSVCEKALGLRETLVATFPRRPEYRSELTQSYRNLGNFLGNMGQLKEAEVAYDRALAHSKELAAEFPRRPEFQKDLAGSYNSLAVLLYQAGRPIEAEKAWLAALQIKKRLASLFPNNPDYQNDLILAQMNLGNLFRDTGQQKKAEEAYQDAAIRGKPLAADFPNRPEFRYDLALVQYNRAILLYRTGRTREAEADWKDALALLKQLAADFPNRVDFRNSLAKTHVSRSNLLGDTGRLGEAEEAARAAITLQKRLVADLPKRPEFRQDLALSYNNLGTFLRATGQSEGAESAFRTAIDLQKKLIREFPRRFDYRSELAGSYHNLAILLARTRQVREAEMAWRSALELRRQLVLEFPKVPDQQNDLAGILSSLATMLRISNRPREAEEAYREAMKIGKRLTTAYPRRPEFRVGLALTYNNLGVLLNTAKGRQAEAEAAYREALNLHKGLVAEFPRHTAYRRELARSQNNLGVLFRETRRPRESEAAFHDAVALWKELGDEFPDQPEFRQEQARTLDNRGNLLLATRPEEGEKAWRDALAVRKQLVADFPRVPEYRHEVAGNLVNLAFLHNKRREFIEALSLLEQARPHHLAALAAFPREPRYRQFYRSHFYVLGDSLLGVADHTRLATTADELARFGADPGRDSYNATCFLCQCVTLADKDPQLTEARRKELTKNYADRALTHFQQAIARGYKNLGHIKKNPTLEPIRSRDTFKKSIAELEGNSKE